VVHSPYSDVKDFIREVIRSFSRNAPEDHYLVFKHHPRDRAYRNYERFISEVARENGVQERVLYIHDAHLPTLIDNSVGVVVINSSVGFQAINHLKPTAVLGKAVYKFPEVAWTGGLDEFWEGAKRFKVNEKALRKLKNLILVYSQLNGSLHKRAFKESKSGLRWENGNTYGCLRIFSRMGAREGCCEG